MPTDRFSLRHGALPPEREALKPYELGFCEENGALYIGGEGEPTRLTFPETVLPPETPESRHTCFVFSEPLDAESAPNLSLFADSQGRLCFKNQEGESVVIV